MSNTFVVIMGMATVFIGLICIVILCKIVGLLCNISNKQENSPKTIPDSPTVKIAQTVAIENRQEIIAAVSAAVAEELGTDISAIRILSFKKI